MNISYLISQLKKKKNVHFRMVAIKLHTIGPTIFLKFSLLFDCIFFISLNYAYNGILEVNTLFYRMELQKAEILMHII